MAEVLQVEFSGVLCQIDGVYILERGKKETNMCVIKRKDLDESYRNKRLHSAVETHTVEKESLHFGHYIWYYIHILSLHKIM